MRCQRRTWGEKATALAGLQPWLLIVCSGVLYVALRAALFGGEPAPPKGPRLAQAVASDADPTARELLQDVQAIYRDLPTYESEGTVVTEGSRNGEEFRYVMDFHMRLKKPNLYVISWSGSRWGQEIEATIWNDGSQPYSYMGRGFGEERNSYSRERNDGLNLILAGGLSGGAASTVPMLFFPEFSLGGALAYPTEFVESARIERVEEVLGEPCYVITGPSRLSREVTFWVSQSSRLIVKYYETTESAEGAPAPEGPGPSPSRMDEIRRENEEWLRSHDVWPSSTETHRRRSVPRLRKADFRFTPPKGAVLR